MVFGIMIYESYGYFYSFVITDERLYEGLKNETGGYGISFLGGKKEIRDEEIDKISNQARDLTKRLNNKESLNLEKELKNLFG